MKFATQIQGLHVFEPLPLGVDDSETVRMDVS